jgi:hypothetical protein
MRGLIGNVLSTVGLSMLTAAMAIGAITWGASGALAGCGCSSRACTGCRSKAVVGGICTGTCRGKGCCSTCSCSLTAAGAACTCKVVGH